ncbi:hypothetical protein Fmac_027559 [Flemingia macrophylla]|uniref:Thaumatin-like protein n=1 Tax=Flemingia macrophylla TaxID=520843 RepID=A0ABD1LJP2_9FABA
MVGSVLGQNGMLLQQRKVQLRHRGLRLRGGGMQRCRRSATGKCGGNNVGVKLKRRFLPREQRGRVQRADIRNPTRWEWQQLQNDACPAELQVKGSDKKKVIACKSACLAFGDDPYCCTGRYNTPEKCAPTRYSLFFKLQCSDAYSYPYDGKTFTCSNRPDYVITFCP